MSFLTRLSLANRGLVALIAVVITGFGVVRRPVAQAAAAAVAGVPGRVHRRRPCPGAGPEIIEEQVTKPIEDAVKGADGLDKITSTTREGSATIQVDLRVRHRPRQRGQPAAPPRSTGSSRRCRDDVEPTIFAGSTDDIPAIVLAASGGADESDLANRLNADRRARAQRASRASATSQVTGTRDAAGRDHARPGQARRRRGRARARSTTRAAGQRRLRPGRRGHRRHPLAQRAGRHADRPRSTQLQGLYLDRQHAARSSSATSPRSSSSSPPATSFTRTDGVDSLGIAVTAAPDGNPVAISHEVRDKLAELQSDVRRQADRHLRPGAVRRDVDREPDHRGPARPADGRHRDPGLPAVGALHAGHRGVHPAVRADRADRAVDRRLLAQPAHPRRADHRGRPGGRRLDRRAGEHQTTSGVRRGRRCTPSSPASRRWPARSPPRR